MEVVHSTLVAEVQLKLHRGCAALVMQQITGKAVQEHLSAATVSDAQTNTNITSIICLRFMASRNGKSDKWQKHLT